MITDNMNLTDTRIQTIIDDHGGNFSVREFGADRQNLNPQLVKEVVRFRNWHGYPSLLTSMYRNSGSHSLGAADKIIYKHWKEEQPDPMELWRLATTWPWWGVGIYFDWTHDEEPVIGLHCDICKPHQRDRPLRWLRARGNYYYQSLFNGKFYQKDTHEETSLEAEIEIWKKDKQ